MARTTRHGFLSFTKMCRHQSYLMPENLKIVEGQSQQTGRVMKRPRGSDSALTAVCHCLWRKVNAALKMVCNGHRRSTAGGLDVFLERS